MPLKYLSYCWRSLETLLTNCKVVLNFKWTNCYVLPALGNADNVNVSSNNIIFIIKETKLYVSVVNSSTKDTQKLPNFCLKIRAL